MMRSWGYAFKDFIVWVKINEKEKIEAQVGKWFEYAVEICIVGFKGIINQCNGIIFLNLIQDTIFAKREKEHY